MQTEPNTTSAREWFAFSNKQFVNSFVASGNHIVCIEKRQFVHGTDGSAPFHHT